MTTEINHHSLLTSDDAIQTMPSGVQWSVDSANYESHPAYATLISNSKNITRLKSLLIFSKSFIVVLIKRLINYEFIPLEYRKATSFKGRLAFFFKALNNTFSLNRQKDQHLTTTLAEQSYEKVVNDGICAIKISTLDTRRLIEVSKSSFDYLLNRRSAESKLSRAFESSRSYKRRTEDLALFTTIESILHSTGIIEVAAKYMGRSVSLVDVNPQINDVSDDFWKHTFPDCKQEFPASAYFHRDASGGDLKIIFYLSDVFNENGAFNYVLGSHAMKLSLIDDYICEANDSNGFAGTTLARRQQFAALPKKLRQKGTFGNDLRHGDPLLQYILDSTWQVEAPAGSLVMFDTKGIHRGGMVQSGERRVITCVLG